MNRADSTLQQLVERKTQHQPVAAAGRHDTAKPVKRSLTIAGHRTSISLEEPFWQALHDVAHEKGKPLASLIFQIDAQRGNTNLSSAIRVFLLEHFRQRSHSG